MEIAKSQIKVKTRDLRDLKSELSNLLNYKGVKLAIVVNRNIKLIDEIIEPIDRAYRDSIDRIENYSEYQKAVHALYEKYAVRDKDGNIAYQKSDSGTSITISHTEKYEAEEESIKNQYKNVIDSLGEAKKELEETLEEENDIVFCLINPDYINEDVTGNEIKKLISYEIIR